MPKLRVNNKFESNQLYSNSDIALGKWNAIHLLTETAVLSGYLNPILTWLVSVPMVVSKIFQIGYANQSIPESATVLRQLSTPLLLSFPHLPIAGKTYHAATCLGVIKNSLSKLKNCWESNQPKKEKIQAAALHIFNAIAQGAVFQKGWDLANQPCIK